MEVSLAICWFQHLPALFLSAPYRISTDVLCSSRLYWSIQDINKLWLARNLFWPLSFGILLFGTLTSFTVKSISELVNTTFMIDILFEQTVSSDTYDIEALSSLLSAFLVLYT